MAISGTRATPVVRPVVRRVAWERVEVMLRELERAAVESDVHPDDWSEDAKLAGKARLLKGLQVSAPAREVRVLWQAQFSTTDDITTPEAELVRVGERLGADMVVWSSRVIGKADRITQQPVSSHTWGSGRYKDPAPGERTLDTYHEDTTAWVPVRISVDETSAVAYFLRIH